MPLQRKEPEGAKDRLDHTEDHLAQGRASYVDVDMEGSSVKGKGFMLWEVV